MLVLTLKTHIVYAYVKQGRCIFGGTKCHATAGSHTSLESFVPSEALDQQAAACTQITAAEARSTLPTLAGPVASLEAQSEGATNVTPLQFLLPLTRFIQHSENALLHGNKIYCFIISHN